MDAHSWERTCDAHFLFIYPSIFSCMQPFNYSFVWTAKALFPLAYVDELVSSETFKIESVTYSEHTLSHCFSMHVFFSFVQLRVFLLSTTVAENMRRSDGHRRLRNKIYYVISPVNILVKNFLSPPLTILQCCSFLPYFPNLNPLNPLGFWPKYLPLCY